MIQRTETISITPTPREIEREIWCMDSAEQAYLILAMAQRYKNKVGAVCCQLGYVEEDFKKLLNNEERKDAIRLFETIVEYLKGDNE